MNDFLHAIKAWRETIGSQNVITEGAALESAQTATFSTTQRIPAIIRPGSFEEVQQCVRIANEFKIPIYPVSLGKNWGFGSRVPVQTCCVVMELRRLNRILDYSEDLAYVTIEPGVTFQQLYEYLCGKGSNLFMSLTGSSSNTSLIGNALERGVGSGPYGDRFNHVCGLEVVLPTGECIHSGMERFPNAKTGKLFRWGAGPSIDGLFAQSNFGIVTKMSLWLLPRPRHFQTFFFHLRDASRLPALVNALRSLKLGEPLKVQLGLMNDYRVISFTGQYPWQEAGGKTPLPLAIKERVKKEKRIPAWHGTGALYSANSRLGRAGRELIKEILQPQVDRLIFIDAFKARVSRYINVPYRLLTGINLKKFMEFAYNNTPFLGVPLGEAGGVTMTYWRKKNPPPEDVDPDRDRCGIIWLNPTVPLEGREVQEAVRIIEDVSLSHGFEPNLGIRLVRERTADINAAIVFDREAPGEDERAMACHDLMLDRLIKAGYYPCRLGIQSMNALPQPQDDFSCFHRALKQALDPNEILAPERYQFGETAQSGLNTASPLAGIIE